MKRTFFDDKRDAAVADEANDRRDLMCAAHGCPNAWSLLSTRLCRWHSAAPAHLWPIVSKELADEITDRAMQRSAPPRETLPLTRADKTAILQNMRLVVARQRIEA